MKYQGSTDSGRKQCYNRQTKKKGREQYRQIDINMGHQVENPTQTPSILPFIKMCSLYSCSQRTNSLHRHHIGQQTVCPPNADSSPGKVLLNHGIQRQTSRHKTICKGGCCSREQTVQCTMLLCHTACNGTTDHLIYYTNKAKK